MKCKFLLFAFAILFMSPQIGFSQQFSYRRVLERITYFDGTVVDKNVDGTPYSQPDYELAKISSSTVFYSVKYNAFIDQMEIMTEGERGYLPLEYGYVVDMKNLNKKYQVFDKNEREKGFFVVLGEGEKMMLLAKENVRYDEAVPSNGMDPYRPARYTHTKPKLYIGYSDNSVMRLPSKKKDFYAVFEGKSKEIEDYIKSNKLNIKKEEDLIEIFNYFNSI